MAVNARAPFLLSKEAISYLKRSDIATIINISSVVGIKGYVNQGAYTASKHALMGFTKVLAQEVFQDGIRVHIISPGGVATGMVELTRPDIDPSTLISPEEIAEIVLFLLTHRGNAVIDEINVRRSATPPWR
jgi:3-oxoacyl-[acyl-carrier protein] reductase